MKEKNTYFDYLRAFAIIGVIFVHVSGNVAGDFAEFPLGEWFVGNFYTSLTRWCVPIFVMVSGALLLDDAKNDSISLFYKKRIMKVVMPFAFWVIVYFVYVNRHQLETITFGGAFSLFFKGTYYPLWFLYMIITLYAITPLIRKIVNGATRFKLKLFLFIWFSMITLYNTICFILNRPNLYTTELPMYIGQFAAGLLYIGYFLLGYYLNKFEVKSITLKYIGLLCVLITFLGTYFITAANNQFGSYFCNYLNFNTVFVSAAIFIILKEQNLKTNILINTISSNSFGIYLVHVLIMNYLFALLKVNFHSMTSAISIPLYSLSIFILSFGFSYVVKKIPIANKIVP